MKAPGLELTFLLLVLSQAAHSIEEYVGRLWEVFAPARFLTGLVSFTPLLLLNLRNAKGESVLA